MINSAAAIGAYSPIGVIRASAASASAISSLPLPTSLPSAASIPATEACAVARSTSASSTFAPCIATVWAMPEPICPAPITATVPVIDNPFALAAKRGCYPGARGLASG